MSKHFNENAHIITFVIVFLTAFASLVWFTTPHNIAAHAVYDYQSLALSAEAITNDRFFQIFGSCIVSVGKETICVFDNLPTAHIEEYDALRLRLPATTLEQFSVEKFSTITRGSKGYPQLFDCSEFKECILSTKKLKPDGSTFSITTTILVKPLS